MNAKNATAAVEETSNTMESGQNPSQDKSGGSKSPGGVPCKVIANDKTRGGNIYGCNSLIKETKKIVQISKKSKDENKKNTDKEIKKKDNDLIIRPRAMSENRDVHAQDEIRGKDRERRSVSVSKPLTGIKSDCREDNKKPSMVVRLHPGQHQKISTNSQNKAGLSSVKWTGVIHHGNQNKKICGLEISFSSDVPQDIDIKLVPDIQ